METFRTLAIGGLSKDDLIQQLVAAAVQFNPYALTLFDHPDFARERNSEIFKLVKLSPRELGIQNPYSLEQVIEAAARIGLSPCPLSLAAYLRLDYLDQPEGAYLTVASTRLSSDETYPTGFYLRHNDDAL